LNKQEDILVLHIYSGEMELSLGKKWIAPDLSRM